MKRWNRRWWVVLALLSGVACNDWHEEASPAPEMSGTEPCFVPVHFTLQSESGAEKTRIEVKEETGADYVWSPTDSIGVVILNKTTQTPQYVARTDNREGVSDVAKFDFTAMVMQGSGSSFREEDPAVEEGPYHMVMCYPYNSSLVAHKYDSNQNLIYQPGCYYLDHNEGQALHYRIPAIQTALHDELGKLSCTKAMSRYAILFDFFDSEQETGFSMRHATSYLRIATTGGQNGSTNYGDGNYYLRKVIISAVHITGSGADFVVDRHVNIAGTYAISFPYDEASFDAASNPMPVYENKGGITHVSSWLYEPTALDDETPLYNFVAFGPSVLENATHFVVEAEAIHRDAEGRDVELVGCTRYVKLADLDVQAGGLYDIDIEFNTPVDEAIRIDTEDTANCYLIHSPGNYVFSVATAGNGILPANCTWDNIDAVYEGGSLFPDDADMEDYDFDWLWVSGKSFEGLSKEQLSEVFTLDFDRETREVYFNLKPGQINPSGNIVVALYSKDEQGNFKEIEWSWHIWLSDATAHHLRFANTRPSIALDNEEWHILDRNLGAEAKGLGMDAMGLYYQVGRKSPMIGPSSSATRQNSTNSSDWRWSTWANGRQQTLINTEVFGTTVASWRSNVTTTAALENDHHYPMWILKRDNSTASEPQNLYSWTHTSGEADTSTKTLYDPCPPGYKIPTTREWDNLKNNEYEYAVPAAIGSGPFGYSMWEDASQSGNASRHQLTGDAWNALNERKEAGDYYEVDEYNGRTYHVRAMSVHGEQLVYFPTSGVLTVNGYFKYLGYNFALWAAGRVDGANYSRHWFGIRGTSDFKEDYSVHTVYAPYVLSIKSRPLGIDPAAIGGADYNTAAPVRCIREINRTDAVNPMSK